MSDRFPVSNAPPDRESPDGEEPCVWMQARLVAYKLCDRDFDCEHCPFDAAMHGAVPGPRRPAEPAPPDPASFPADRYYARQHTWVMAANGRRRVGLDAFAAALVRPVGTAILPPVGAWLESGQPGCWLADECGPVPVAMPVSGRLTRGNRRLRQWPQLAVADPYGEGWLLEMDTDDPSFSSPALLDASAMQKRAEEDWNRLKNTINSHIHSDRDRVGATLQDGGERLMNLRSIMGPTAYSSLVREFL